jgi:hypothetical protein
MFHRRHNGFCWGRKIENKVLGLSWIGYTLVASEDVWSFERFLGEVTSSVRLFELRCELWDFRVFRNLPLRSAYCYGIWHNKGETSCLESYGKVEKSIVCFVGVYPTLIVRLGSPDRLSPSDILCCAKVVTNSESMKIYFGN